MPRGAGTLNKRVMRGAWRLAMRVFTDKMPPLQQALFNAAATEHAAIPAATPLITMLFTVASAIKWR